MLMGWLDGRIPTVVYQEYSERYHTWIASAVEQQQCIGWLAAIRGFLSVEWGFLASLSDGGDKTILAKGIQTMRHIMKAMHQFSMTIWRDRNLILHGTASADTRVTVRRISTVITYPLYSTLG
jgi:hypothetical protein